MQIGGRNVLEEMSKKIGASLRTIGGGLFWRIRCQWSHLQFGTSGPQACEPGWRNTRIIEVDILKRLLGNEEVDGLVRDALVVPQVYHSQPGKLLQILKLLICGVDVLECRAMND